MNAKSNFPEFEETRVKDKMKGIDGGFLLTNLLTGTLPVFGA